MGIAGSPKKNWSNMSELMTVIEFVKTYLDDLLIISKSTLKDHLEKLRVVLKKLWSAGFRINAAKSTFCSLETEYLGYALTRQVIAPQTKKIDSILALSPPTKVKELHTFVGMVQYYQDMMWKSQSKMLVPLTDLVGKYGQTKVTKAEETKKEPWHWDENHQKNLSSW